MADEATEVAPEPQGRSLKSKTIIAAVVLGVAVVAWLIGAAWLPRWWGRRMGALIDGRLAFGSLVGVCMGFVFTMLPLAVLRAGWKYRSSWRRAFITLAVALLIAAPNLATLGIVAGNGNAAHAGERILDVDGPGFRGGSLVGAVLGALAMAALLYLLGSRSRNKHKAKELQSELQNRDSSD